MGPFYCSGVGEPPWMKNPWSKNKPPIRREPNPRPRGGGGGQYDDSRFGRRIDEAYQLARQALQDPQCASIFRPDLNPVELLDNLFYGRNGFSLAFEDLGGRQGQSATAAHTSGKLGLALRLGEHIPEQMTQVSTFIGATVNINSNPQGPFLAGYDGYLGIDDAVHRAMTLIHELGHAVNIIELQGSMIRDDDTEGPTAALSNRWNSIFVYEKCFRSR
jgi:hypothetical protein